jgi:hypothetical protein
VKFTVLNYNPSRHYQWSIHKAGCADIERELKGRGTDSGFPAEFCQDIEAVTLQEALDIFLEKGQEDEEGTLSNLGYDESSIRINPCCKEHTTKDWSKEGKELVVREFKDRHGNTRTQRFWVNKEGK